MVREMDELRLFLLNLYGKFRGKEFVRAYMGSGKKSLELGIRQTTAVLSNPDRKSNDGDDHMQIKELLKEAGQESLDSNNINYLFKKINTHNNQPGAWKWKECLSRNYE